MNSDDLDPPRPVLASVDLQTLSIGELKAYILSLQTEIRRVESMISFKESHRTGADSLFAH